MGNIGAEIGLIMGKMKRRFYRLILQPKNGSSCGVRVYAAREGDTLLKRVCFRCRTFV
jgi:hypothetical protein